MENFSSMFNSVCANSADNKLVLLFLTFYLENRVWHSIGDNLQENAKPLFLVKEKYYKKLFENYTCYKFLLSILSIEHIFVIEFCWYCNTWNKDMLSKQCRHRSNSSWYDIFFFYSKNINIFLFLHENICCRYSLEVPQWGTSNEYLQYMFSWRNSEALQMST